MLLTDPRSYQAEDATRLDSVDAWYLAYDMGCGKSLVPIIHINEHRPAMSLILCPKSVVQVWPREFEKHLGKDMKILVVPLDSKPGKTTTMSGRQKLDYMRERWKAAAKAEWPIVFVINYEAARMEPMLSALTGVKRNWDVVVADELHRCKSPSGATSRFMNKLSKVADKRIGLSGTPMPHSPLDLWSQFRFLDKSIFGWNFTQFKSTYAEMDLYNKHVRGKPVVVKGFVNLDHLNKKFYSIATRVKKDDVLDLPPATHINRYITMDTKTRTAYREMEQELVTEVNSVDCVAINAMVKVTRLQQITSGFAKTNDGVERELNKLKTREMIETMGDIDAKEPITCFCRFKWDLRAVEEAAKELGRPFYGLWGGRDDVKSLWKPEPGGVLAAQISSGSTGIDLTASAYNIYVSQTWNMGEYDQSLSRTHRHGQDRPVFYIHLLVSDSIDPNIQLALQARAAMVDKALTQTEINRSILDHYRKGLS